MIAAAVNAVVVALGALLGLAFGGRLREEHTGTIVAGLGICVVVIGITSAIVTANILIVIVSMVLGTILGELLKIEARLDTLGDCLKARLGRHGGSRFTEGFVTASLLFCVGSMAIMGSFDAGLRGDYQTIFAKSALDGVMAGGGRGAVFVRGRGGGDERRGRRAADRHRNQYPGPGAQAAQGGQYASGHGAAGDLVLDCGTPGWVTKRTIFQWGGIEKFSPIPVAFSTEFLHNRDTRLSKTSLKMSAAEQRGMCARG